MKVLKNIRKQDGAATIIEASLIFPICFIIIIFLFYYGMFQLELYTLQMRTDRIADLASRSVVQSGYLDIGELDNGKIDFNSSITNLDEDKLSKIYKDLHPYRYWGSGAVMLNGAAREKLNTLFEEEQYMKNSLVKKSMEIKPCKVMLSNKVKINVTFKYQFPKMFKSIGVPSEVSRTFSSTAYVSDTSEFMRNTEFVAETVKVVDEKYNISGKIEDIMNKIKKQFEFLGVK